MKFLDVKRSVEIFFLILGFILLLSTFTLLDKPLVNQGVASSNSTIATNR